MEGKDTSKERKSSEPPAGTIGTSEAEYSRASTPAGTNNSSTKQNNNSRHARALLVLEYYSRGLNQTEIAEKLGISQATVSKDLASALWSVYDNVDQYSWKMYGEHERGAIGLRQVQKQLWSIVDNPTTEIPDRLRALSQLNQSYVRTIQTTNSRRNVKQWVSGERDQQRSKQQSKAVADLLDRPLVPKVDKARPNAFAEFFESLDEDDTE